MNRYILGIFFILMTVSLSAQKEAITTISCMVLEETVQLDEKDKRTYSKLLKIEMPDEFWQQFERVDAVFLSSWMGTGDRGLAIYEQDEEKLGAVGMDPLLYFAEKDPKTFTRPEGARNNFGIEQAYLEIDAKEKCIKRYRKKKMHPKWFFNCLVTRSVTISPVDFMYKEALPRKYYAQQKPAFELLLRTSSKVDTVVLHYKLAMTIVGVRRVQPEIPAEPLGMNQFLRDALFVGMKAEGFPLADAEQIIRSGSVYFVGKCPICGPVENGIKKYIQQYEEKESTVPNDLILGLSKDNREDQQKAFSAIVNRYIKQHYDRLEWNEEQRTKMQTELEAGRKQGMNRKSDSFGDFCPSCDGACGHKPGD